MKNNGLSITAFVVTGFLFQLLRDSESSESIEKIPTAMSAGVEASSLHESR